MVTGSRDKTIKLWAAGEDGSYSETSTLVRALGRVQTAAAAAAAAAGCKAARAGCKAAQGAADRSLVCYRGLLVRTARQCGKAVMLLGV